VVGKYFYDLPTNMTWGDLAVNYKLPVNRTETENTAFTMWFKTKKTTFLNSPNTYDILLEGYSDAENKGYRFTLDYGPGSTANSAITKTITAKINSQVNQFQIPVLKPDTWYALVVNHMNEFSQLSIHIWEMKYNAQQPTQNKTTDLKLLYNNHVNITPEAVINSGTFQLRAGTLGITNVRIWSESMEEEKQPITLNQYVVKDARYALIIDNAIPPLRMVKEYVR